MNFEAKYEPFRGALEIRPNEAELRKMRIDTTIDHPELNTNGLNEKFEYLITPLLSICKRCPLRERTEIYNSSSTPHLCGEFIGANDSPVALWNFSKTRRLSRSQIEKNLQIAFCKPILTIVV